VAWAAHTHIHDLADIEELCRAVVPNLGLAEVPVEDLTPYAVELRYDLDFAPSEEQTKRALALAE